MTDAIVQALSWFCILAGCFFTLTGALGLVRMPDVFTRMHGASIIDTLGAGLLIGGLMLQAGLTLVSAKLLFILALIFFTGPVITHALAQAAIVAGVAPALREDRSARLEGRPSAADRSPGTAPADADP